MDRNQIDRIWRGMFCGFSATLVVSVFMFIKSWSEIAPQVNLIGALVKVSTIWLGWPLVPWIGWGEHFFVGTVLWGIAYALLEPVLPGPGWLRGILFSLGAWILMMVLLMPPAGAGWFAVDLGIGGPISGLILNIVYGFFLGTFFYVLQYEPRRPVYVRR
jgi:hypothetical protein